MKTRFCYFIFLLALSPFNGKAQSESTFDTSRFHTVIAVETALLFGSLAGLGVLWYSDTEHSSFHSYNDNKSWMQMDKAGHAFAAYNISYYSNEAFEWAGLDRRKSIVYSGAIGFSYLSAIEIMDGFSKDWGFSWGDMAANLTGTALFVGQELVFKNQPIRLKYSYHNNKLPNFRKDVLGENFMQQMVKDYNGQTYWASINLNELMNSEKIPSWLNLAFGYGATGMVAAENTTLDIKGSIYHFKRYRQYYFSLDIALEKIKTKSQFANSIFKTFSVLKVPLPTYEYSSENGWRFHPIYF